MTRLSPGGRAPSFRGAESYLYEVAWLGVPALAKHRLPKSYRHPALDERLRRARTVAEARSMLLAAELGVPVPAVLYADPDEAVLVVERVEGVLLSDMIEAEGASRRVLEVVERLGYYVGLMHEGDLVHGDLTTSNVVVRNGRPYLIDFGLSERTRDELDKAVDVHLFLRSLESTHPEHVAELYEAFLAGYARARGREAAERVRRLVERIRVMGRYVEEARRVSTVWGHRG